MLFGEEQSVAMAYAKCSVIIVLFLVLQRGVQAQCKLAMLCFTVKNANCRKIFVDS